MPEREPELIPPRDELAEEATIGALLLGSREALSAVIEQLHADDFYHDAHRRIFRAITQLFQANQAVDMVTVASELRAMGSLEAIGGLEYLDRLTRGTPLSTNAQAYAGTVKEKSILRRLLGLCQRVAMRCYDEASEPGPLLDQAQAELLKIAVHGEDKGLSHIKPSLLRLNQEAADREQSGGGPRGLKTGFSALDSRLMGLNGGDLVVLAARPGMGKTSLAMGIASNVALVAQRTACVGLFSLEMSIDQIVADMLCSTAGVDLSRWRAGVFRDEDWERIATAQNRLAASGLYIDDSSAVSPLDIRARARHLAMEHGGLDLLIVDYLQLMATDGRAENRVQQISALTRALKGVAKDLNVPILLLSQLSRAVENRDSKRPVLSDLRESGQIEADADVVMFIHRPAVHKAREEEERKRKEGASSAGGFDHVRRSEHVGFEDNPVAEEVEILVEKHRNGATGPVRMGFISCQKRFVTLDPHSST